jgi:hypothetical protein
MQKNPVRSLTTSLTSSLLVKRTFRSVHNHFNQERHLYSRDNFKLNRAAALSEWRGLGAA